MLTFDVSGRSECCRCGWRESLDCLHLSVNGAYLPCGHIFPLDGHAASILLGPPTYLLGGERILVLTLAAKLRIELLLILVDQLLHRTRDDRIFHRLDVHLDIEELAEAFLVEWRLVERLDLLL